MILECNSIFKNYEQAGNKIEVLKGINLNIEKGESVALVGQSGSGKSTLLSLLSGMDKPSQGEIFVSGMGIHDMNEEALNLYRAKSLGIIFQQYHLLENLTALENVMLPLELSQHPDAKNLAMEYLEKVALSHRHDHMPSQMSGGENQRVAIARALVMRPQLLLADEPSGSLDEHTGSEIMDILLQLVNEESMTMLLVTHNNQLADLCHRKVILKDGIIQ